MSAEPTERRALSAASPANGASFSVLVSALGLFLILLASDKITGIPGDLRKLLLLALFCGYPAVSAVRSGSWLKILGLSVLFGLIAVRVPPSAATALVVAFWLTLLGLGGQNENRRTAETESLLIAGSLYSLLVFFIDAAPFVGNILRIGAPIVSEWATGLLVRIFGSLFIHHVKLGPTAFGFYLIALLSMFAVTVTLLADRVQPIRFMLFVIVFAVVHAAFVLGAWLIQGYLHNSGLGHFHALDQADLDTFFCAGALLPLAVLLFGLKPNPSRETFRFGVSRRALLLVVPALLLVFPWFAPHTSRRILIVEKGTLDLRVPTYDAYGDNSGGMFGAVPRFFQAMGHDVTRGDIADHNLDDFDLLFFANLYDPLPPEELDRVQTFLHNGGAVLLLADHTGGEHIQDPSNEILAGTGIQIAFDTAHPSTRMWTGCMEFSPHYITRNLRTHRQVWLWLGASLFVRGTAEPLLIGDRAFSDWGTRDNTETARGYLGDLQYHRGEHLGDIIVAATSRIGQGQVVVFGDTSPSQNGALPMTYRFMDRVIRWATWRSVWRDLWDYRLPIAAGLALIILVTLVRVPAARVLPVFGLLPLVMLVRLPAERFLDTPPPVNDDVGWVDVTHDNYQDATGWEDDSLGGLQYNLYRAGFLPLVLWEYDDLVAGPPGVLLIHRPTRAFTGRELDQLVDFIERGGRVVFAAGWEDRAIAGPILERFGLRVRKTPLGPSKGDGELGTPQFYRANPTAALPGEDEPTVLCEVAGFPVVVSRTVGKGRFVHIADSCFWYNKNLEGQPPEGSKEPFVVMENIEFLKRLFARLKTKT